MKKIIISIIAFVSIFVFTSVAMGNQWKLKSAYITDTVKVKVFGQTVETDVIAAQKEGENSHRYYVSAADLALYLGYNVTWDSKTKSVNVGTYSGASVDPERVQEVKAKWDQHREDFLSKLSPRQLDSFYKELAVLHQAIDTDPVILMMIAVDDYKGYKEGKESALGYLWESMEE